MRFKNSCWPHFLLVYGFDIAIPTNVSNNVLINLADEKKLRGKIENNDEISDENAVCLLSRPEVRLGVDR